MSSRKNWSDSTIFIGDNLDVMRGMNSLHIDLIYLDPPFNSNHNYAAPIGSEAAGAAFKDTWTLLDVDNAWHGYIADKHPKLYSVIDTSGQVSGDSMKSYLIYMAIRILEMKRLLKNTGSIYLHCDSAAGHYLKLIMDAIFGRKNFRNEIVWSYRKVSNSRAKKFLRAHDLIYFYSVSNKYQYTPTFDSELSPRKAQLVSTGYNTKRMDGKWYLYVYNDAVLKEKENLGKTSWETREEFDHVIYVDTSVGNRHTDVFEIDHLNSQAKENVKYPTQKPRQLLERIINASSSRGDRVFDPFCGCATTCIAAEDLRRKWVACDISSTAGKLVEQRMRNELGFFFDGKIVTEIPKRSKNDLSTVENELFGDVKIDRYNSRHNKYTLYGKQKGICNGCAEKFQFKIFEVDHINPQSKLGSDHISNLQLLCPPCNRSKGDKSMDEFMKMKRDEAEKNLEILDSLMEKRDQTSEK